MSRFPRVVDDVSVRLVAGLVLVVTVVALVVGAWWLYLPLLLDFVLRAAIGPQVSPLALLVNRVVRPRVRVAKRPTAGPPKRFAAAIGATVSAVVVALWLTGAAYPLLVALGVVMVVFPALESILGVCVGCLAFGGLMRLGIIPEEVCLECADITLRQRRLAAERSAASS